MKKFTCIIISLLLSGAVIFTITANALSNGRMPNGVTPGDYQDIIIYKLSSSNDSVSSYSTRSALYYPMDGTVNIGGSHYEIESNPNYESKDPSSDFRYIVGDYYTNLD